MRSGPTHRTSFYLNYLFKKKDLFVDLFYFWLHCVCRCTEKLLYFQSTERGLWDAPASALSGSRVLEY